MVTTDVFFSKQFNGYNRDEVDRYIRDLILVYQKAYEEYKDVCARYNDLLEEYKTLAEQQDLSKSNITVITRTLFDTESLAHKILADARAEADRIKAETQSAVQRIREEAYAEKAAAKVLGKRLIDEANIKTIRAEERARELISDAQAAAARIGIHTKQIIALTD
jgi:cell division septum initiation protein DivIVA